MNLSEFNKIKSKSDYRIFGKSLPQPTDVDAVVENIFSQLQNTLTSLSTKKKIVLASYLGMPNELPTLAWISRLVQSDVISAVFAPKILTPVKAGASMEFYELPIQERQIVTKSLKQNAWMIPEPLITENTPTLTEFISQSPKETEVVFLLPGLLFDRSGTRLGYGGGYYDRYLGSFSEQAQAASIPFIKIAACLPSHLLPRNVFLPWESFDQKIDILLTDTECLFFNAILCEISDKQNPG